MRFGLLLLLVFFARCGNSQKVQGKYKTISTVERFDRLTLDKFDASGDKIIVFEKYFDDSIKIICNEKIQYDKQIKTLPSIGAVYDVFYFDSCSSNIEILFLERRERIILNFSDQYQYIYLNRNHKSELTVDYSNTLRQYK